MHFFNKYKDLFGVPEVIWRSRRVSEYQQDVYGLTTNSLLKKLTFLQKLKNTLSTEKSANSKRTMKNLSKKYKSLLNFGKRQNGVFLERGKILTKKRLY